MGEGPAFHCWRFPPTVFAVATVQGLTVGAARPTVQARDGCGEFSAAPAALAAV